MGRSHNDERRNFSPGLKKEFRSKSPLEPLSPRHGNAFWHGKLTPLVTGRKTSQAPSGYHIRTDSKLRRAFGPPIIIEDAMAAAKSSRSKKSAKSQKRFFFLPVQNFTEELGYRISVARRVQGLTQSQLAKKSQTSLTTYKRIEKGDMTASIGTILSILYSLGELESCDGILSSVEGIKPEELPQRIRKPNK